MYHELRQQMNQFLAAHHTCILSCACEQGSGSLPVNYINHGLKLVCLLPRWADVVFYLENNPQVTVLVIERCEPPFRWLQLNGAVNWVDNLYLPYTAGWAYRLEFRPESHRLIAIDPVHFKLVDESLGWGPWATLDL